MDIEKSDLLKETMNFVENIEFSEFQPKTEIKEEEGVDEEVWKFSPFDVKPKVEQVEASEIGEAKIKTEPEEFFSNNEMETLHNESIDIKDEFMGTMKNFVSDIIPLKNIEQQIDALPEKEPNIQFTVTAGENNPRKNLALLKRPDKCKDIVGVNENKKAFECSFCPYKVGRNDQLNRHIAIVHSKNPFLCSMCPSTFGYKYHLNKHVAVVHEMKKFECSLCPYNFAQKEHLDRHMAAAHEKNKPFECYLCPRKFGLEDHLNKQNAAVHGKMN